MSRPQSDPADPVRFGAIVAACAFAFLFVEVSRDLRRTEAQLDKALSELKGYRAATEYLMR